MRKLFLVVSLVEMAVWFVVPGENAFIYLSLPLGAVLFGLFLIFSVLEKETLLHHEENRESVPVRVESPSVPTSQPLASMARAGASS